MSQVGVYAIINRVSGRQYVGSSVDIPARFRAHRLVLRSGRHGNPHLQRAWDHYGPDAFQFQVLEICAQEDCRSREQWYFDNSEPDNIYNIALDAHRGAGKWGRLGKTNSPEHNARIGEANRGRPSPRKGQTHDWGSKAGATQIAALPYKIRAEHLDGRVLVFDSVRLAAMGTGLKRKSVSNILNGWKGQTRSRTGWTFTKQAPQGGLGPSRPTNISVVAG